MTPTDFQTIEESLGSLFFILVLIYYFTQLGRLRHRKKLDDTDGVKKVKKQMLWGIPVFIVLFFAMVLSSSLLL